MTAARLAIPFVVRVVAVGALALAGAFQVVRSAVVQQSVAANPALAAKLWPRHPQVELALAMAEIGTAASAGQAPGPSSVARSVAAARVAPLAIEPFLIRGAIAQSERNERLAERLFVEAARRDPRSAAARFFLAQRYLSTGRPGDGLRHASVLVRLVAGGPAALVPAISQYAKSPGALPTLRRMFAGDPGLRGLVLSDLARDAANHDLIVKLAGDEIGKSDTQAPPEWQVGLLRSLVERGEFARAHSLWLRISGLRVAPAGIFNPQFAKLSAPAPFNWTFSSGEFGFAEPTANKGLQIIYYGRANAEFANQTLLLAPGTYELKMRAMHENGGDAPSGLTWTVACTASTGVLLNLPLGAGDGAARVIGGRFAVPAGCVSQTIRLTGTAREFAASEQVTIDSLQLVRLVR